jgi:peptidoglycan hydrolase CwlO-like protein
MKKLILLIAILLFIPFVSAQDKAPEEPKPTITLEALQSRLQLLNKDREQMVANVNALDGAIQECQHWIDQLSTPKEPKKAKEKHEHK